MRRGIVLLAVGGGLWLGHGAPMAWTILVCLGAAYVLLGLIALLRADQPPPSSDFREPPAKP